MLLEKHQKTFGSVLEEVTADSGYCSEKNLLYLKEKRIESYIKLQDHEKRKTRAYAEDHRAVGTECADQMTTPLFLLRCVQLGISIRDLDLLTIGMVNDMYAESGNDEYKGYSQMATQSDMDAF